MSTSSTQPTFRCMMPTFDHFNDGWDDKFQQNIQSDLDMLVLEKMYENAQRENSGGGYRGHEPSGWKNRGPVFWIVLILAIYWFFLRPLDF